MAYGSINGQQPDLSDYLPISGGIMKGGLTVNGATTLKSTLNMTNRRIMNVATPSSSNDAVNKNYVDNNFSSDWVQLSTVTKTYTTRTVSNYITQTFVNNKIYGLIRAVVRIVFNNSIASDTFLCNIQATSVNFPGIHAKFKGGTTIPFYVSNIGTPNDGNSPDTSITNNYVIYYGINRSLDNLSSICNFEYETNTYGFEYQGRLTGSDSASVTLTVTLYGKDPLN